MDYERVNETIHLSRPLDGGFDLGSPSLILLFGWALAKLDHIKKYASVLRSRYPTSTIMIIENQGSWFYQLQATREANIQPVVDVLDQLIEQEGKNFRGILLHVMSNGGALQLMTFSKRLSHTKHNFSPRFPVALVLDSAPDNRSMQAFVAAIVATIQNPALKSPARLVFSFAYCAFYMVYGYPKGFLVEMSRRLNTRNLIPFASAPPAVSREDERKWTPRLYVCSDADEITPLRSVLAHAEESRRLGYEVRTEVFEGTPHVSHAKNSRERYWTAVEQLWRDACARKSRARL